MTNFTWGIDGSIVGFYLLAVMIAGVMVRRFVSRVDDFLVAGREMNVYLGIASLAATEFGMVTCMYAAQNGYQKGFSGAVPGVLMALAMLLVGLTGFCIKPLRDSGVMTIPELFERRFGPRIRWLSGVVIVLGGLLNMGVFLRTGGEFLLTVCNLSPFVAIGGYQVESIIVMMALLLLGVATYTVLGGMLSVLVTDFLQFVVMSVGLIAVTILVLYKIGWSTLVTTVETNYGDGGFNPFVNPEMGWQYVIFNTLLATSAILTWQTAIVRVLSAKDSRTGMKVYSRTSFFFVCRFLIPGIWGIAALAMLSPETVGGDTLLAMPKFLGVFVPVGLMGILIAAMLAADMSTDSSYMITWAGVIYNDILRPFHKNAWSERRGLLVSRTIVAAIGVFLLFFGLLYEPPGDLWTYLGVTGAIYLTSMSALLIACCYWNRANDWGAGAAIVVGAVIPIATLGIEMIWKQSMSDDEWTRIALDVQRWKYYAGIAAYVGAGTAMVVGSLLKPKRLLNGTEDRLG